MKKSIIPLALLTFSLTTALALTNKASASNKGNEKPTIEGLWLTQNKRSVLKVVPCKGDKEKTCGYLHWITKGGMTHDTQNPDETLQSRPLCGLKILEGFSQKSARYWDGGTIYKADDGDTYDAYLQLKQDGTLKLRGFIGVSLFGKTQHWTKADADSYPECTLPAEE